MATFREYMAEQAEAARQAISAAKKVTGGMSSTDVQELFRLQDVVYLNELATAAQFWSANRGN